MLSVRKTLNMVKLAEAAALFSADFIRARLTSAKRQVCFDTKEKDNQIVVCLLPK